MAVQTCLFLTKIPPEIHNRIYEFALIADGCQQCRPELADDEGGEEDLDGTSDGDDGDDTEDETLSESTSEREGDEQEEDEQEADYSDLEDESDEELSDEEANSSHALAETHAAEDCSRLVNIATAKQPALTRTCRQIRGECLNMFYAVNRFAFRTRGKNEDGLDELIETFAKLGPAACAVLPGVYVASDFIEELMIKDPRKETNPWTKLIDAMYKAGCSSDAFIHPFFFQKEDPTDPDKRLKFSTKFFAYIEEVIRQRHDCRAKEPFASELFAAFDKQQYYADLVEIERWNAWLGFRGVFTTTPRGRFDHDILVAARTRYGPIYDRNQEYERKEKELALEHAQRSGPLNDQTPSTGEE